MIFDENKKKKTKYQKSNFEIGFLNSWYFADFSMHVVVSCRYKNMHLVCHYVKLAWMCLNDLNIPQLTCVLFLFPSYSDQENFRSNFFSFFFYFSTEFVIKLTFKTILFLVIRGNVQNKSYSGRKKKSLFSGRWKSKRRKKRSFTSVSNCCWANACTV